MKTESALWILKVQELANVIEVRKQAEKAEAELKKEIRMSNFKEMAKQMKNRLRVAVCAGPIEHMDKRLSQALDDFEGLIIAYADDVAVRRAVTYYNEMNGIMDGEPILTKDEIIEKNEKE